MIGETIWRRDIFTHLPFSLVIKNKEHAIKLAKYSRDWGLKYYHK